MRSESVMGKFVYNVKDRRGKYKTGKLFAESEAEVKRLLEKRGCVVLSVYEVQDSDQQAKPKSR